MTSTQQNYNIGPAVLGLQATHLATVCEKQLETEGKQHQGDKTPAFIFCLVKCTQQKPLTTKVIYIYRYIYTPLPTNKQGNIYIQTYIYIYIYSGTE